HRPCARPAPTRHRRALRDGAGRRGGDRPGAGRPALWRSRLHLPRSGGPQLVVRPDPRPQAVTADDFRRLALELPEAIESAHMGHPDFRVGGKIFATLSPAGELGMVKLTPDQQEILCAAEPEMFVPVPGGWGRGGSTHVRLAAAEEDAARGALRLAWRGRAPAKMQH